MRPIDIAKDNIDFCMASAQKGLMAMTGLSFVIGKRALIEASRNYPTRSYYCNLALQYDYFEKTGEMHFTPPVQTIYAARQAIKEYFAEGESEKWARHQRVFSALHQGLARLGFREIIRPEWQSGLVIAAAYPDDPHWDFDAVHDYCYARGFTIYPGKIAGASTFRLCALGEMCIRDRPRGVSEYLALAMERSTILWMRICSGLPRVASSTSASTLEGAPALIFR